MSLKSGGQGSTKAASVCERCKRNVFGASSASFPNISASAVIARLMAVVHATGQQGKSVSGGILDHDEDDDELINVE